jgi:hypothetical protein
MKTEGNYKEMPMYCPFAYLHAQKEHFDVIVKAKLTDKCVDIKSEYDGQTNDLIYKIHINSKNNKKIRGNKLLYLNKIELPIPSLEQPYTDIVIKVIRPGINDSPGGTTVIRYGDVDTSTKK